MPSIKNPKADLRRFYNRTIKLSIILSLAVIIAAFKFSPYSSKSDELKIPPQDLIKIDEITSTVQKPDIPEPPKAPKLIEASTEDLSDDLILPDISDVTSVNLPDNPPVHSNVIIEQEPFIDFPEEYPSPIGGLKSIQEKVHYTEIARRAGIEGTVIIEAFIDKNGNVADAKIKVKIGGGLDEEALKAVKLTKFIPGRQRGMPVNVRMIIPVKFVLR